MKPIAQELFDSQLDPLARMPLIPHMHRVLRSIFITIPSIALLSASCTPVNEPPIRRPSSASPSFQAPARPALPAIDPSAIPKTPPPNIYAESAIVVDINSGKVLYSKNADSQRAVASTQKLITALCVLDAGNIDKPVTIAASDANCEPTKLGLAAGDVYSRRELLKVLMVKSANDIARALARDVAGSQEAFATLMNRKCQELGMRNSHFRNPHGLTEPGQYSTARDMAIAGLAAYKQPLIRQFAATKSFTFQFNNGRTRFIESTNKVLKTVPYCNGLKTGTTNASGRCLVASGKIENRAVVAVVLKSNTPNIWTDSTKLLRWALETPSAGG